MKPIHTEEHAGFTIEYYPDLDARDPREEFDAWGEDDVRAWEEGEVFGFIIRGEGNDHVDSCWGFYGWKHCQADARGQAEWFRADLGRKRTAAIRGAFAVGSGAVGVL